MPNTSFFSKVTAYGFELAKWCQRYGITRRLQRQKARARHRSNHSAPENETSQNNPCITQQLHTQTFPLSLGPDLGISGDHMPGIPLFHRESLPEDSRPVVPTKVSAIAESFEPGERIPAQPSVSNRPEETVPTFPRTLPAQSQLQASFSSAPDTSELHKRYFLPANPTLRGYINEPEGNPPSVGVYSDVWRCRVHFSGPSEGLPTEVAVKVLRPTWLHGHHQSEANKRLLQRFQQEAITWLGAPNHPNIVPLIGWILTPSLSFVSPWYNRGSLAYHLENLSETQRATILRGIAKGLDCLHSCDPPIVHGDLKPENVLLSDWGEPLLADFGLSTILGEEEMYSTSHGVGGSVRWMSPEQMIGGSRSCQSDVYSFGSLGFAVLTGVLPHAGLPDVQILHKVCNSTNPKDPVEDWAQYSQIPESLGGLLQECWSRLPEERPTMSAIVLRLTALLDSLES